MHTQPHTAHSWNRKQRPKQETGVTGRADGSTADMREVFPFQDLGLTFRVAPLRHTISSKGLLYTKTPHSHTGSKFTANKTQERKASSLLIFLKRKKKLQTGFDKIIPRYHFPPPKRWYYYDYIPLTFCL